MRITMGLAAAAVLAAGTLGIQSTSVSTAAPAAPVAKAVKAGEAGVAASALKALASHPGQARDAVEQEFTVTDTMVDPDGATHVRMERSFRGLPVIGGDLVVHQASNARLSSISQTLAPARETRTIANLRTSGAAGLGNHFYYLLAEGSGAKTIGGVAHNSPTCNGSTVTGIGRDAAQKIWFRALTTYFTSGTTYAQARSGTLSAAKDLYGVGGTQYNAVAAAWSAVSVG